MNHGQSKRTHLNRRQLRGMRTVRDEWAQGPAYDRENSPTDNGPKLGGYMVRRYVTSISAEAIPDDHPLLQSLAKTTQNKQRGLSVSIINPKQAMWLTNNSGLSLHEVRSVISERVEKYKYNGKETVHGFLGKITILGAPYGVAGPRYVGYRLDSELETCLLEEQRLLLMDFGSPTDRLAKPHLTLLKTSDQQVASKFADELRLSTPELTEFELGKPELFPVKF